MEKKKKKKLVGFKNVSELDWGYAQFQSYINIKFYYQYFFPLRKAKIEWNTFHIIREIAHWTKKSEEKDYLGHIFCV